ncbi:LysR family transcriptional regulator [Sedimenticola sp.]|uniref:LysR family transcriptional regulator n=1 Tax=Sedimenticola sp. TaxID=1940285 RepID=UPI003D1219A9
MNDFNWNDLRYFLAAVESGTLSGASRQLHTNQPTTGRRIDRLEQALGLKLFQRHPLGLTLTQDGERLYPAAQKMAHAAILLAQSAQVATPQLTGTVRIAATEGICAELIAPHLPALQRQHPDLQFVLIASNASANLTRGEADIALRLYRPDANDLVIRQVGHIAFALYASDDYLQHHPPITQLADLADHMHIGYGDGLSEVPEQRWLVRQLPNLHWVLRSDSTLTTAQAAVAGVGIGLLPRLIAARHPQLHELLPGLEIPSRAVWSVIHQDLRQVERYRVTLDFLSSLF